MKYVIDACNLIFRDRRLEETLEKRGFVAAKELLVSMLSRFAHAEGIDEVIAVFDGSEKAAHHPRRHREAEGKVILIFADPRTDADRYIIEHVEDAKRPGEITVVSSDKFIVRHVQKASGHTMGCRDFLRRMSVSIQRASDPLGGEDPRKFKGQLSDREIGEWMKYFGFTDGD
jgi:predicted RNA-binding protein with PIN domain